MVNNMEKKNGVIAPYKFKGFSKISLNVSEFKRQVLIVSNFKADVDNMGKFLENSDVTNSFESFDSFSKTMDNFFSLYVPNDEETILILILFLQVE